MAIKRILPVNETQSRVNSRKNKDKFKTLIGSADTVAKLQKAVKVLSKCVFGEGVEP